MGWGGFLMLSAAVVGWQHDSLRRQTGHTEQLNRELMASHNQLVEANTTTILGLAKLAEFRNEDTGQHLERLRA